MDIIKTENSQSRQEGRGSKVQGQGLALSRSRNPMKRDTWFKINLKWSEGN